MDKNNISHSVGITTVGEKGQVVIPAAIRKNLRLRTGEKLFVFAKNDGIIGLSKFSNVEKFASHLATIQDIIKKTKKNK